MSASKNRAARKRRYPINRIKQSFSYDANEIAKLFGVHRNTVRHWLKDGLKPIDDRRPILVHGGVLKAFLAERQDARRQTCAVGEFFCFRCRAPRLPWGGVADALTHTAKIVKIAALCEVCETPMHRAVRRLDLPKFSSLMDIQPMALERLNDRPKSTLNCASSKD